MKTRFEDAPGHTARPRLATDYRYGQEGLGGLASLARRRIVEAVAPVRNAAYQRTESGRRSIEIIEELRGAQEGQVGVIICNGPSLANVDLRALEARPYLLLNRGALIRERLSHSPTALCVHDPLVLRQFGPEIAKIDAPILAHCQGRRDLSSHKRTAFLQSSSKWQFASYLGLQAHHGCTVTFWGLQLGFHLGWRKALIVGMDHRFSYGGAASRKIRAQTHDRDHFDGSYYPPGTELMSPDIAGIEYSYVLAREAYRNHGREVVDCTEGGQCEVFRHGRLEDELES